MKNLDKLSGDEKIGSTFGKNNNDGTKTEKSEPDEDQNIPN